MLAAGMFVLTISSQAQNLTIQMTGENGSSAIMSAELEWPKIQATTGQSRRRGNVKPEDLHVTRRVSAKTPGTIETLATGKVIPEVTINSTVGNRKVTLILTNALVSSHALSFSRNGQEESFTLSFEQMSIEHSGGTEYHYNKSTN